jgi:putative holliday junction resolvase
MHRAQEGCYLLLMVESRARASEPGPKTAPPVALGLDYGRARVGVAISDELGLMAHPRPPLKADGSLVAKVRALAESEGAAIIVVGLPLDMRGHEGDAARGVRTFISSLRKVVSCPVELIDERLTTRQASLTLSRQGVSTRAQKAQIDSAAACILLQVYLDRRAQAKPAKTQRKPSVERDMEPSGGDDE